VPGRGQKRQFCERIVALRHPTMAHLPQTNLLLPLGGYFCKSLFIPMGYQTALKAMSNPANYALSQPTFDPV
jgi:hypothetical protein